MRKVSCVRHVAGGLAVTVTSLIATAAFWLLGTEQAFAIPSPELVVGSFVSISQLFALASAVLGGGAAYATMRVRSRGGSERMSRGLLYAAVGMFVLLTASVGFNIYQRVEQTNERQARLEQTLLRPATTPGGPKLDPMNLELSYSQMVKEPRGITTEEAAKLIDAAAKGERDDLLILDVRETAERDMGLVPGATFVRFPDFKAANIDFTGKKAIFFCHNGNRSWETCEALAKLGIDCRFVIGGLEKWIVEQRPLTGLKHRTLADLRAIPEYRNHNVLFDTPQVHDLVKKEAAIFVDIRYPAEFAAGHLPNAINLNIRATPTPELPAKIAALPKKPIIIPCYDRRGCFFSEVLGLELVRAGFDFRGRYTLPWEYFVSRGRPPYVDQWVSENNRSLWAKSAKYLAGVMSSVSNWTGILGAIALLALLSRLLVLPFSLKAERDQISARAAADELDALKSRLKDDPVRRTRAIRGFYKRHGITPARNLLALLFLPVMAVALLAVQDVAAGAQGAFLWMPGLADRDPWLILPLIFGVLITLYIDLAFATNAKRRMMIWIVALPLMTATGALFGAGADIYLITSAVLLLAQRLWVSGQFERLWQAWRRSRVPDGIIALDDVSRLENCGNKAYRLARMRAAGMPVPDGLLLTPACLTRLAAATAAARQRELDWIRRRLGNVPLAVRSSGSSEDGANHSFAGVFESVIDVDRAGLEAAIARVQASFDATRAGSYRLSAGAGNVLVQRMVDAEYSGVLFTRDPSAGGLAMVEMVQGTAENLVSGMVRPDTYRFGRVTKKPFGSERAPIDLAPLLALGDVAERLFGGPQDMEWTYRDGAFHLVQSRDITRPVAGETGAAAMQNDLARVVDIAKGATADQVVFGKNELSEMLPRPTPLSLSLMEALWASGGSIDLAARQLGLSYRVEDGSTYLVTILGRLYVDKREEQSRALVIGPLAARRLLRDAERIERDFRDSFLPQFAGASRLMGVADFEKLSTAELVSEIGRLHDRFVHDTHVAVDVINIAASFYLDRARRALTAEGIDPSSLLGHIPETFESHAIAEITATSVKSRRWLMLKNFGHRALLDYELAEPRYAEDLNTLNRMVAGRVQAGRAPYQDTPVLSRSLAKTVDIARRFQTLKEDAKHHSLCELAVLRRAVLVLDRRFGLDGRAFYLGFDELLTLSGPNAVKLRERAAIRQEQALRLRKCASLSSMLTPHDLEAASAGDLPDTSKTAELIHGTRVSGSKVVQGRARVIAEEDAEHGNPMEGFRDGDIIVTAMINPAWLPYFSRAGGFVSEVGGWLSHPAILAREYDVAMIVGTEGMGRIIDGSLLRLHLDGRVEVVAEDSAISRIAAA